MSTPFIQDREASRRMFLDVWKKYQTGDYLTSLENLILGVILAHVEYHELLSDEERALGSEFSPEKGITNPFLHMGMHIALQEQLATDRPSGIGKIYRHGVEKTGSAHEFEHMMMNCLGEALWKAQQNNTLPDEEHYLECLRAII